MKKIATYFIAAIMFSFSAFAGDVKCRGIPLGVYQLDPNNNSACICGEGLAKLPISAPAGMSLVAACNYHANSIMGEFYFKGAAVVSGKLRRDETDTFGDSIWFDLKNSLRKEYSAFRSATDSLNFGHISPAAKKTFHAPKPTEKSPCWVADATIKIEYLYVIEDSGTDAAGSYPLKFEVLKIGPYTKCPKE